MKKPSQQEQHFNCSIDRIVFDPRIYPRKDTNQEYVKELAQRMKDGAVFDPITLDQNMRILDGKHRQEAYLAIGERFIPTVVVQVKNDADAFRLACKSNSRHGRQFTREERQENIRTMYLNLLAASTDNKVTDREVDEIAADMGVYPKTVKNIVRDVIEGLERKKQEETQQKDDLLKEAITKNPKATQTELANMTGIERSTISRKLSETKQKTAAPQQEAVSAGKAPEKPAQAPPPVKDTREETTLFSSMGDHSHRETAEPPREAPKEQAKTAEKPAPKTATLANFNDFLEKLDQGSEIKDSEEAELKALEKRVREEQEKYGIMMTVYHERLSKIRESSEVLQRKIREAARMMSDLLTLVRDPDLRKAVIVEADILMKAVGELEDAAYKTVYRDDKDMIQNLNRSPKGNHLSLVEHRKAAGE